MRLGGKVVVVTGGSMGIGEALARAFAAEGAAVVLTSRDLARAEAARLRVGFPERTLAVAGDVTRRNDLEHLLATTLERFGRVDVWINNAGFGLLDGVTQFDMAECRRLFDTNLFSVIEATQLVAPVMQRQGGGTIINVSSVSGYVAVPYSGAYGASKHALNAISNASRAELRGTGVHVLNVCPGFIATDFSKNAVRGKDRKRLSNAAHGISADKHARAVLKAYLKGKRELIHPWKYRLIIRLYQLFPGVLERFMLSRLRLAEEVIAEAERVNSARRA